MKRRLYLLILLNIFLFKAYAQVQPYGLVDTADLKMTSCDFEKDANAEILFDKGLIKFGTGLSIERHIRIKIFNAAGKNNANVRLIYQSVFLGGKGIGDLQAETINFEGNNIVVTPVEKTQIYNEKINKNFSAIVFSFPNVKAGSIIEYKYNSYAQRVWYFQNSLPTRYSEIKVHFRSGLVYKPATVETFVRQPFVSDAKDSKEQDQYFALANIHSLPDEPYMTARQNNLQRIIFSNIGFSVQGWGSIANELIDDKGFGKRLDGALQDEGDILKNLLQCKTEEDKIAFLFDTVKNRMRWNNKRFLISTDGIQDAWKNRTGNSADINLALLHLLKISGINAMPMVVCTRDYGKLALERPDIYAINNTVVYIPVDTANYYLLDASDRYALYYIIPYNILNSDGLAIDPDTPKFKIMHIRENKPVIQSIYVNAEVSADGKINGNAEITSDSYNKIRSVRQFNRMGKQHYIDSVLQGQNNIRIASFKAENATVDTLPLRQKFAFNVDLTSSDANYIFFNTNLFTLMGDNPFKEEQRFSDIDMGYRDNYTINGIYKLPAGFRAESLPKNTTVIMPDQSIVFKRTIVQDNDTIVVRYSINHKKTIYFLEEYQDLRGFYKKMYELLNEQIVLKKL